MFYVLNIAGDRSSVLTLDGCASYAEAARRISWQVQGGFPASHFVICTYDPEANRFRPHAAPEVRYEPAIGPYTPEAWATFCDRIGYAPGLTFENARALLAAAREACAKLGDCALCAAVAAIDAEA